MDVTVNRKKAESRKENLKFMKKLEHFNESNSEGKFMKQIEEIMREINNTSLKKTKSAIMEKLTIQLKEAKENNEISDKKLNCILEKLLDKFKNL